MQGFGTLHTHVSNLAALCILAFKKAFQSKRTKGTLILLAAVLHSKLLSADAPHFKLAWVISSDAFQS